MAELDFGTFEQVSDLTRVYKSLPRFPASTRDLAFVCTRDIPVLRMEREIAHAVGKILESIALFDVYEGEQIPQGMKSVAFNLTLRSPERTLTDDEADSAVKRAIAALEKGCSVVGIEYLHRAGEAGYPSAQLTRRALFWKYFFSLLYLRKEWYIIHL